MLIPSKTMRCRFFLNETPFHMSVRRSRVIRVLSSGWSYHPLYTTMASTYTITEGSKVSLGQPDWVSRTPVDNPSSSPNFFPASSSSVNEGIVTSPRIPPPRRHVSRWFFPGFTGEETHREDVETPADKMPVSSSKKEKRPLASSASPSNTTVLPSVSTESHPMQPAGYNLARRQEDKIERTRGVRKMAPATNISTPRKTAVLFSSASLDDDLPSAFREYQERRNQSIKTFLSTALGSAFTKAGMDSDGLRTSFSAAASEATKEAVGLRRISPKVLISFLPGPDNAWNWVDISAHPTASLDEYRGALSQVLIDLGTHETLVSDALEPMLLPQTTVMDGCHCLVVRYAEDVPKACMDGFQELTNRLTILVTDTRVMTIHRTHCEFVENIKWNWLNLMKEHGMQGKTFLLNLLVKESVDTFNTALTCGIVEFDNYEGSLFSSKRQRSTLAREMYHIKRRASVYARVLVLTGEAYSQVCGALSIMPNDVQFQDVQQDIAHVRSLSEELHNNAESGLQLLFQLSSFQLNELMRVLTIFSAFFIPLSFVASIYGMNFEHLPLIEDEYGHMYCIAMMVAVGGGLGVWFKLRHFI
ncbi:magnesium and cobalt transport protein, putative [Trypanosoma cruzi marinkellei]|uniref:Magnesium and cobalt transport protein, putative n=1 Tax=Trypanosoma cruzi marinkellei TaxID=85056 RepID=K2N6U2_TRYCR|nr:magnesium and cobalt transport protein, putative [Trypanosoma cruzi marinkellei]